MVTYQDKELPDTVLFKGESFQNYALLTVKLWFSYLCLLTCSIIFRFFRCLKTSLPISGGFLCRTFNCGKMILR